MSGHLSADQISGWVGGERAPDAELHVGYCAKCAAEIARLEATLMDFRGVVRSWSDRLAPPAEIGTSVRYSKTSLKWALALAALCILATVPVYRTKLERRRATEQQRADTVLLQQVDAAVSQRVPSPMEPLMTLVSWRPDSTEGNGKK
jgi:hypothetical protein